MNEKVKFSTGKRVLFTGAFIVVFVLLLEGLVRLVCILPGVAPPRKTCRFESHSQEREYGFVKRKKRNLETEYLYDMYSPTRGWVPRPGFDGTVTKAGMTDYRVRINSLGARSDREIPYEKDPNTFRVVVLGCSVTFGEGVSNGRLFPDLLEARLERTEWVNLAVHGYANDQMLITLEEEGRRYAPDLVLLGFHPSVIYRNTLTFRDFAKPMYVLEEGELKLTNVPVPSPEEVLQRNRANPITPDCSGLKNLSYIYRHLHRTVRNAYLDRAKYLEGSSFLRAVYPRLRDFVKRFMRESPTAKKYELQGPEWTITQRIFLEMQRITREDDARFLLVLYQGASDAFEEEVEMFARDHDIPFCNISPPFREALRQKGPMHYSLADGHWNETGHEMAAEAVDACLRERGWPRGAGKEGGS